MHTFIEQLFEQSYNYTTETAPSQELWERLSKELTESQNECVRKLMMYKDVFITNAARDNYRAGFCDAMDLMMAVYHRQWEKCN